MIDALISQSFSYAESLRKPDLLSYSTRRVPRLRFVYDKVSTLTPARNRTLAVQPLSALKGGLWQRQSVDWA
jgi:hypothetical protein